MTNKDNRAASESKPIPLENALNSDEYVNSDLRIPLIIGYDEANKLLVENLTRMPHLLVAGCSGSGKSTFLRNVITSITSCFTPDEVKLVLFDLKKTEFNLYAKDYPHASGVITDIDSAVKMLRYLLDLSRERSKLIADAGIISSLRFEGANAIDEYNAKTGSALPRIVVIIDEFAELTKSEEVEELIFELTRIAHGAGIHLILASQRAASDEVITDRILANIPTRACFRAVDEYDSFRIIGKAGAEDLTCGEMIYSSIRVTQKVKVPYVSYERSLKLAKGKRNENRF
jgi:S-DNA-T family DNA segregation ATPase FtsK/SpoIIIE